MMARMMGALLLLVAFAGKFASGFLIRKPRRNQMAIGLPMVPHGEVGLIFAQLGFSEGIFGGELYAALIIVIALTTVSPPFFLKWFTVLPTGYTELSGRGLCGFISGQTWFLGRVEKAKRFHR